jgi:cell division protein FtsW (lipid II flippase)
MRNKKTWLIIKAVLILLFTVIIFVMPTEDSFRKWLRFGMLTLFVASFIIDLTRYKKNNG